MSRRERLTSWIGGRLTALRVAAIRRVPEPWASVVGVDEQEHSRWAAAWAAALTPNVHVLYARERGREGAGASPQALEGLATRARQAFGVVEDLLEEVQVGRHVTDAATAPALASAAGVLAADLLVIPPALHQPSGSAPPDRVAEGLAHSSAHPVLFASHPPREGEVLAGLAVERSSRGAAAWAVDAAALLDAHLRAVHAIPEDADRDDPVRREGFESKGPRAESVLVEGPPTEVLLREIRDREPALTVVGHGRRAGWIGSTTRDLVAADTGPLLVVPYDYAPPSR